MTKNDYDKFKKFWLAACDLFPNKPPSETSVLLAFSALAPFSFNQVKSALGRCLRESRFMPTVADVVDYIQGGKPEDLARIAYKEAVEAAIRLRSRTSVKICDPLAMWAIMALGGWTDFCMMDRDKSEKLFCQYYVTAFRQRPEDIPDHLPGQDELRDSILNKWNPDMIMIVGNDRNQTLIA